MKEKIHLQTFAEAAAAGEGAAETPAAPETEAAPGAAEKTEVPAAPAEEADRAPEAEAAPSGDRAEEEAFLRAVRERRATAALAGRTARAREIAAAWETEAKALKEIYPDFDLRKEARENTAFSELLQAGVSVRRAYEAANLEAILGAALGYAARTAGSKAAMSLRSQAQRVQENSVLDRAPSVRRKDVNSLTQKDILKILDEVSRGAKIKF